MRGNGVFCRSTVALNMPQVVGVMLRFMSFETESFEKQSTAESNILLLYRVREVLQ